jgi:lysophospholipid acyltransferase (LPLAT)-like uncharacterized protein
MMSLGIMSIPGRPDQGGRPASQETSLGNVIVLGRSVPAVRFAFPLAASLAGLSIRSTRPLPQTLGSSGMFFGHRAAIIAPDVIKRIVRSNFVLSLGGFLLATYYWLVGRTNWLVRAPQNDLFLPFAVNQPVIIALWHGEHFLMPVGWRPKELNLLITSHRDGEVLARACNYYGLKCIRGSGGKGSDFVRKKAVRAFAAMLRVLRDGGSVALTADVPKIARVAGLGIVTLAKHSGRPIVPVAVATSRRYRLSNWDRTCINLPFGWVSAVKGKPIFVSRDSDDAGLESARLAVEASLNEVTARAYGLVDSKR